MKLYGFGIKGFTLSMVETAIEVTDGRVPSKVIGDILAAGRDMLVHPVETLPHARDTLERLAGSYRIILITKGDLFDQERKLAASGLGDLFDAVEIVSDKTAATYERIFTRYGDGPGRAMMVGNSLKSDVVPAIEAGSWGVYVPHDLTWEVEHAQAPEEAPRFRRIADLAMIASVAGAISNGKLTRRRPFRTPHHSASMAAMVGGGIRARPGEASLAHNGVLFLDELPEFSPQVLDSLRQPLETGETMIARANYRISYPSRVQLVAAMNPCKCGMAGEPGHVCRRGPRCVADYQARISGPLLDRIDIRIDVPAVSATDLILPAPSEPSAAVAERVAAARAIQRDRFAALGVSGVMTNAQCATSLIESIAAPDLAAMTLLRSAAEAMKLSARGYHRVLKVARTLADLDGAETVGRIHLAEALSYRVAGDRIAAAA